MLDPRDPTYDVAAIKSDPVWHLAWVMSECENDNAPIGWGKYIGLARCLTYNFDITAKLDPAQTKPKVPEDVQYCPHHIQVPTFVGKCVVCERVEFERVIESLSAQLAAVSKQFVDMKTYADQCDRKIADLTKANQVLEKLAKQSAVIQIDAIGKDEAATENSTTNRKEVG